MKQKRSESDDKGASVAGLQVLVQQYQFILTFFSYDKVTADKDYTIARSFRKYYSQTIELVVSFPDQVMLSQAKPPRQVVWENVSDRDKDELSFMPSETYAYSTQQPFIMNFDIEV